MHELLFRLNPECTQNNITIIRGVNLVKLELHAENDGREEGASGISTSVLVSGLVELTVARDGGLWVDCLQVSLLLLREQKIINRNSIRCALDTLKVPYVLGIR